MSVEGEEFVFRIDAFTPDTLPMARLAEYMAALARLVGYEDKTHFRALEEGSAKLIHKVEEDAVERVENRLRALPQDAAKAFKLIDDLLVEDGAVAELVGPKGRLRIAFPGRTRPKPLCFPVFRQQGSIEGQIVTIGGRDTTAHLMLQDGMVTHTRVILTREQARDLAPYLYGPKIRLIGNGRWERHADGSWKMLDFKVDRHELLDDRPLADVLGEIRALPGNDLMQPDAYMDVVGLRSDDGAAH